MASLSTTGKTRGHRGRVYQCATPARSSRIAASIELMVGFFLFRRTLLDRPELSRALRGPSDLPLGNDGTEGSDHGTRGRSGARRLCGEPAEERGLSATGVY